MVEVLDGSEDLRKQMPFGAIKEIAETFGHTPAWVAQVIAGNKIGNPKIIECAGKVALLHSDSKIRLTEILGNYEKTNK